MGNCNSRRIAMEGEEAGIPPIFLTELQKIEKENAIVAKELCAPNTPPTRREELRNEQQRLDLRRISTIDRAAAAAARKKEMSARKKEMSDLLSELSQPEIAPQRREVLENQLRFLRDLERDAQKPPSFLHDQSSFNEAVAQSPAIQNIRHNFDLLDPQIRNPWAKVPNRSNEQMIRSDPGREKRERRLRQNLANHQRCKKKITKDGTTITLAKCCITESFGDHEEVVAAHLIPLRAAAYVTNKLELFDKYGVNNFRNLILLSKGIEAAYDDQRICFIKNWNDDTIVMKILDPTVRNEPIHQNSKLTIGEFEGSVINYREGTLPYTRVLSFHAQMSYIEATKNNWKFDEKIASKALEYGSPLKDDTLYLANYVEVYSSSVVSPKIFHEETKSIWSEDHDLETDE